MYIEVKDMTKELYNRNMITALEYDELCQSFVHEFKKHYRRKEDTVEGMLESIQKIHEQKAILQKTEDEALIFIENVQEGKRLNRLH
jgi:hypothetical protein